MNGSFVTPYVLQKSSLEYMICAGSLILAVAYFGVYDVVVLSRRYHQLLSETIVQPWPPFCYLGSLGLDITDTQWYYFTRALPFVAPFFIAFLYAAHRIRLAGGAGMVDALQKLHIMAGMALGFAISGSGFFFAVLFLLGNYYGLMGIHNKVSFTVLMVLMWSTHIVVLFLNNYFDGYRWGWLGLGFLDYMTTPLVKWTTHYNMSILRMIAFNMDMYNASVTSAENHKGVIERHLNYCVECAKIREAYGNKQHNRGLPRNLNLENLGCYKLRTEYPRPPSEYNLLSYFGYILYPPLFVAGPMSSFNAYVSHLHCPTLTVNSAGLRRYGIRALSNFLLLTVVSHYMYIIALLMNVPVLSTISFPRRAIILYLTLGFLWLKFNCLWKLFRLVSLIDGVDVPEDMRRCFTNTVSVRGFWRDWHASFNLWIVRYMYVPMGGNKKKHLNIFPIFFFIAIWHDVDLRLLHWAGIISVGFLVEVLVSEYLFHPKSFLGIAMSRRPFLYRYVRIIGASFTMLELVIVNLVGFSIGLERAEMNLKAMWSEFSLPFLCLMWFYFYAAACIAIQDRDQEKLCEYQDRIKYSLSSGRNYRSTVGGTGTTVPGDTMVSGYNRVENPPPVGENEMD